MPVWLHRSLSRVPHYFALETVVCPAILLPSGIAKLSGCCIYQAILHKPPPINPTEGKPRGLHPDRIYDKYHVWGQRLVRGWCS